MDHHVPQRSVADLPREPGTIRQFARPQVEPVLPPQPDARAVAAHPCREPGFGFRDAVHFDHHAGVPFRESEHLSRALILAVAMFFPAVLLLLAGIAYALVFVF